MSHGVTSVSAVASRSGIAPSNLYTKSALLQLKHKPEGGRPFSDAQRADNQLLSKLVGKLNTAQPLTAADKKEVDAIRQAKHSASTKPQQPSFPQRSNVRTPEEELAALRLQLKNMTESNAGSGVGSARELCQGSAVRALSVAGLAVTGLSYIAGGVHAAEDASAVALRNQFKICKSGEGYLTFGPCLEFNSNTTVDLMVAFLRNITVAQHNIGELTLKAETFANESAGNAKTSKMYNDMTLAALAITCGVLFFAALVTCICKCCCGKSEIELLKDRIAALEAKIGNAPDGTTAGGSTIMVGHQTPAQFGVSATGGKGGAGDDH